MSEHHLIGIGQDAHGHIIPLFAVTNRALTALEHHKAVVCAVRQGPVLPVMFGSLLGQDPSQLALRLSQKTKALHLALAGTIGLVEMGVHFTKLCEVEKPIPQPQSGRDFLRTIAKKARAESALAAALPGLQEAILAMNGVSDFRILNVEVQLAKVALSAQRRDAPHIAIAIEALATREISVEVSGPWPLYSFGADQVLCNKFVGSEDVL